MKVVKFMAVCSKTQELMVLDEICEFCEYCGGCEKLTALLINTRTHQEVRLRMWTFTQYAREVPKFAEITQNNAITPFKVIQGHRFWYQSKAHMRFLISD